MPASGRYYLGLALISGGVSLSFAHHVLLAPRATISPTGMAVSFAPPLLAAGAALPLFAFVHQSDIPRARLARAAGWYLGGAVLFGLSVYASFIANFGAANFEPETWFSVANWTIGGSFVGLIVANYDLRRARAIQEAVENQRTTRQLAERLSVLNRILRHDVRNKTNIILGNAELLRSDATDDEALAAIEDAANTMVEIADRARRVQSIVERQTPEPIDLEECLQDIVGACRTEYPEASISVTTEANATVSTFPVIRTVIGELLDNALAHNPLPESDRLATVTVQPGTGKMVELVVTDNGPGIPQREQRVFAHETETPLEHSRGTSLWLARWVAQESGGEVRIDPSSEEGTTVVVALPAADS